MLTLCLIFWRIFYYEGCEGLYDWYKYATLALLIDAVNMAIGLGIGTMIP